ncbi:hypothetical protein Nmel_008820 [Mimus melanotis]
MQVSFKGILAGSKNLTKRNFRAFSQRR